MDFDKEMSLVRDLPGYKIILKSVLKYQIQTMVKQLAEFGDEECFVMTAGLKDGTICTLGSGMGKDFLESRLDLKTQFLAHCITHEQKPVQNPLESQRPVIKPLKKALARPTPYTRPIAPRGREGTTKPAPGTVHIPDTGTRSAGVLGPMFMAEQLDPGWPDNSFTTETHVGSNKTEHQAVAVLKLGGGQIINTFKNNHASENVQTYASEHLSRLVTSEHLPRIVPLNNYANKEKHEYANEKSHGFINEHCETGSHMVVVKQEPVHDDMGPSWHPAERECAMQETSLNCDQNTAGNQTVQDLGLAAVVLGEKNGSYIRKKPCPLCPKLISIQNMKKHLVIHSGIRKYDCKQCGRRFAQRPDLKRHIKQLHKMCEGTDNE